MGNARPKLLYLTDLHYESKGRVYYREDLDLSRRLASDFDLVLCDPRTAHAFLGDVDGVVFRNTGPVSGFADEYREFRELALETGTRVFNELTGRADMLGKQYLVDLWDAGFPVVPTVDRADDFARLPAAENYVVKPKDGADSDGLEIVDAEALPSLQPRHQIVQPRVDFRYEVSFYFLGDTFQYALYAPDPDARWRLEAYEPNDDDLAFTRRFVDWNDIEHGIQRVDATRTRDGELLLMELEDINPYLSLDLLPADVGERFVAALRRALLAWLGRGG